METAQQNRAAILASLRTRGIKFRLCPGGEMQFLDAQKALTSEERDRIDVIRPGLTAELRREAGLCERCAARMPRGRTGWCVSCNREVGTPILEAIPTTKTEARRKRANLEAVTDLKHSTETDETERMEI